MSVTRNTTGSIELKLQLGWKEIEIELQKQTKKAVKEVDVPGFRKGKAPPDMVTPKLDQSQLLSKSLSMLLPQVYSDTVSKNNLKPILYPQIRIDKGKWGEDFQFTATTCEAPVVTLPENYSDSIKKLEFKDPKNVLPDILEYFLKNSHVLISDLLITEEVNHRLAHLADNLSQLSMDMNKYLNTKKITAEELRTQTASAAQSDLKIEFIINAVQIDRKLPDRKSVLDYLQSLPAGSQDLPKT